MVIFFKVAEQVRAEKNEMEFEVSQLTAQVSNEDYTLYKVIIHQKV